MARDFEAKVLEKLDNLVTDVSDLKRDVRRLEFLHEETADKIDQIIEVVSPELEHSREQDQRLDRHEQRITKLERTAA